MRLCANVQLRFFPAPAFTSAAITARPSACANVWNLLKTDWKQHCPITSLRPKDDSGSAPLYTSNVPNLSRCPCPFRERLHQNLLLGYNLGTAPKPIESSQSQQLSFLASCPRDGSKGCGHPAPKQAQIDQGSILPAWSKGTLRCSLGHDMS